MRLFSGLKNKYFDSFLSATGVIFLSNFSVNIFNLVFWLFMVRRLSVEDYGILNSLFAMFMIMSLPVGSFQTVITKFVSQFYSQKDFKKLNAFLYYLTKRILLWGLLLYLVFVLFSTKITSFMNLPSVSLVNITGIGLFISAIQPIPLGVLQGLQEFLIMAVIGFIAGVLKLVLGIILVVLGFKVMGAMGGFVLSSLVGLFLACFKMPRTLFSYRKDPVKTEAVNLNHIYSYFFPVVVGLFCFMVLTNIDVILVKHYFIPLEAGYYSIAQVVGKIILFLPGAVSIVMFPKVVDFYTQNRDTVTILKKSLAIVGILCFVATLFSFLFPRLILIVLTGKDTLQCVPLIRLFSLAMSFFALAQILIYYHLSIHSFKYISVLGFLTLSQVLLITLFHKNLIDILYVLLFISILLFFSGIKLVNFKPGERWIF